MNLLNLLRQTYFKTINKNYFSQFGEDRIIKELIKPNYKNGFYIDVGCYHPKKHSNTYLLLKKKKLSGINIDIESDKIKTFKLLRPRDENICSPISNKKSYVKVVKYQNFGLGSHIVKSNKSSKDSFLTNSLDEILLKSKYKNRQIDLLNIDTEGSDFKVLKSLNLKKYKPKIIIIESLEKDINEILKLDIYKYLIKFRYKLRSWNFYSLIFVLPNSKILLDR